MDSVNKKIKGTKRVEYNGILFKSTLECTCYKKLELSGLNFEHESEKFILWEGLKLNTTKVYSPKSLGRGRFGKDLEQYKRALVNITYTPDFKIIYKDFVIYFDVKGWANERYPIKKKMFLKLLDNINSNYIFMEPHSVKQILQAIDLIKEL